LGAARGRRERRQPHPRPHPPAQPSRHRRGR
jgi:hypothetical protein